jgi:D-3-phosphoglycerate dehydrogenase / 2-oxoglutarate reductase
VPGSIQEEPAVAQPERRPVVLVAEELAPSALEVLSADFELRSVDGADRAALLPALADVDAVLIRSATKIDAEALAAAGRLKVVARAGIGLDNVDVAAATARGVMVVNAPTSNIVSAAEHAVALLLAVARNVPAADASLQAGQWKRSKFTGVEVADKTVGVVGLGRIGVLVAQRLSSFGVRLLAYDPYVQPARAAQIGVRLVSLPELLAESDFVTIHLPKTPETLGLIGAAELAAAKPGLRIVNAARGGLVDEQALADALRSGQVAGAGIDVFVTEPATESPLFGLPGVVVTPHLGASTVEAQDKAGLAVARSVKLALQGEFVPDAVNVQAGGPVAEEVRPGLPLAEKLGRVFTALAGGVAQSITVEVRGEISAYDVSVLQLAALKGVFTDVVSEQVTFVNAPLLAKDRGVDVGLATYADSEDYRNLLTVRGVLATGEAVSVSGTLTGPKQEHKLTEVEGYDVDLRLEGHLLFFRYTDRPGIVGSVGATLGDAGINIAGAQVSRTRKGGEALMTVSVDSAVPAAVLAGIGTAIGATAVRAADIDTQ